MTEFDEVAMRRISALVTAGIATERYAEHANKLALSVAKRMGSPNVSYEAETRREFLWLKRKLLELEAALEDMPTYYGEQPR